MPPCDFVNDVPDSGLTNTELSGQGILRNSLVRQVSNLAHLCFGQCGIGMRITTRQQFWMFPRRIIVAASEFFGMGSRPVSIAKGRTTLIRRIPIVVGERANKQMIWIYTASVIATMTNQHSFWNFAKRHYVGKAVRALFVKLPVSRRKNCSLPIPTLVGVTAFNFRPETSFSVHFDLNENRPTLRVVTAQNGATRI